MGHRIRHPLLGRKEVNQHYWTCRMLSPAGDCLAYEDRPELCRKYPYGKPCEHGDQCQWDAAREGRIDEEGREMGNKKMSIGDLSGSAKAYPPEGMAMCEALDVGQTKLGAERCFLASLAGRFSPGQAYLGEDPDRLIVAQGGNIFSVVVERIGQKAKPPRPPSAGDDFDKGAFPGSRRNR